MGGGCIGRLEDFSLAEGKGYGSHELKHRKGKGKLPFTQPWGAGMA